MAEETVAIALEGQQSPRWLDEYEVNRLLEVVPTGNLKDAPAQDAIQKALDYLQANSERLEALATERADALLQDHLRIRQAARDIGEFEVSPCLPVDVIGTYVLLPDSL
jgi:hypothetical protein